jgi:ubiquinone/menaquinone biosynthesis C-methylase UbiE
MPEHADIRRLRQEYDDRSQRFSGSDLYSLFNQANLFTIQQRQRDVLSVLRRNGFYPLQDCAILDLGCGSGNVLLEYQAYGARSSRLQGVDLIPKRLFAAKKQFPNLSLACADGRHLPYEDEKFDLVLQYTVFTSVLDPTIRQQLATEMMRVLRRPHGMILWYDFWLNPTNPQTKGIRPKELKLLFPGCSFQFRRVTLAPPIARRLVPISWMAAEILEKLRIFNSHYLVAIRPQVGLQ